VLAAAAATHLTPKPSSAGRERLESWDWLRFHDLRHSYGTWLADDGIVPNKLAKVMGHEDIATTMQLYVRRTEDHDAIRDRLDG